MMHCFWLDDEKGHMSKKQWPQSYNLKKLNSAKNLNVLGSRFLPRASGKKHSTTHTLI